jgi:class 3 adenylate cyclase
MSLKEDLAAEVRSIFARAWQTRDGLVVPEPEDLQLSNDGVNLKGTVLYADMDGSTRMVDQHGPKFCAEVYKAFLYCAGKVVRAEGGAITAYDGDRVMAVFIGDIKNTSAARAALKINFCAKKIINPAIKTQYPEKDFEFRHTVGIDTSDLLVARTGVWGANDLVWVGRAANYAAKLTELSSDYPSRVTKEVYDKLMKEVRLGKDGADMWEAVKWKAMGDKEIYRSNWWWSV